MTTKKRVVIAEDHQLFREGLRAMFRGREDIEIVAEADDGLEAIGAIRKADPDLLLLDLSMPRMSGGSVIKDVRGQFPDLKILVLTVHESDQHVLDTFNGGVNGYCVKDATRDELLNAVDSVMAGKTFISPGIADKVMQGYLSSRKTLKDRSDWETITHREREVLKLLAEGYMNKEIGKLLNISIKTVEKHRANIMSKLDLHNAASLTTYAIEKGLIFPKHHTSAKDKKQEHDSMIEQPVRRGPPVKEPPEPSKEPPVDEPQTPPPPPPPKDEPPFGEPPGQPDKPPVKEPPQKDPDPNAPEPPQRRVQEP
jgi:DNA-binding NarL/FixJ family response regulator